MDKQFSFTTGAAQLVGEQDGAGDALILLHAGVCDRRMWLHQVADLKSNFQVVTYDRRGFGETTSSDQAFSNVQDLKDLLDDLELSTISLCGCSQGGLVAINFALEYPEMVTSLILSAPAVSGAPGPDAFPAEIKALLVDLEEAEEMGDIERVNAIEASLWLDGPTSAAGRVRGPLRDLFLDMNGLALRMPELTQEIDPLPAWTRLSEIRQPTLIVRGDLDFPHVEERCQQIAESISGARTVEIPGTAHLPNLERPETFNRLVHSFLR